MLTIRLSTPRVQKNVLCGRKKNPASAHYRTSGSILSSSEHRSGVE
jgi:hypothetical protein